MYRCQIRRTETNCPHKAHAFTCAQFTGIAQSQRKTANIVTHYTQLHTTYSHLMHTVSHSTQIHMHTVAKHIAIHCNTLHTNGTYTYTAHSHTLHIDTCTMHREITHSYTHYTRIDVHTIHRHTQFLHTVHSLKPTAPPPNTHICTQFCTHTTHFQPSLLGSHSGTPPSLLKPSSY